MENNCKSLPYLFTRHKGMARQEILVFMEIRDIVKLSCVSKLFLRVIDQNSFEVKKQKDDYQDEVNKWASQIENLDLPQDMRKKVRRYELLRKQEQYANG